MRATRIMADLRVAHVEAAKSFYTDYLGLSTEEFNMMAGSLHLCPLRSERPARHSRWADSVNLTTRNPAKSGGGEGRSFYQGSIGWTKAGFVGLRSSVR